MCLLDVVWSCIGTRGRCVVYVCVCCMWYGYRYGGVSVYGIWGAECFCFVCVVRSILYVSVCDNNKECLCV